MTITLPEPVWVDTDYGMYALVRHFILRVYRPTTVERYFTFQVTILGHCLQTDDIEGDLEDAKNAAIAAWHHECGAYVAIPVTVPRKYSW